MVYQPEKLEKVLSIIQDSPYKLDMFSYISTPSFPCGIRISHLIVNGKYVEPECGTTMCLGGHMAHEYIKEQIEEGNDVHALHSMGTRKMALAYVGIDRNDPEYIKYYARFSKVFYQLQIKTVRGLHGALKRQKLLCES